MTAQQVYQVLKERAKKRYAVMTCSIVKPGTHAGLRNRSSNSEIVFLTINHTNADITGNFGQ